MQFNDLAIAVCQNLDVEVLFELNHTVISSYVLVRMTADPE